MGDVTVKLSRRYEAHGETFDSIVLREPKWRDYVAIGEIHEQQLVGDGVAIVTHYDRLDEYAQRLIQSPKAPGALANLDLVDTMKMEREIVGFFTTARQSLAPSTSSSGEPDKASETSAT